MAEFATLARPYAHAIFKIAKQDSLLDRWSRTLAFLAAASADESVRRLLESPSTTDEQKVYALAQLCGDGGDDMGEKERELISLLARNGRLDLFTEIDAQFEALRAEEERTLEVEVVAAYELSQDQRQHLLDALRRRFEREIQLSSRVDANLLGGAIIRAGDTVIDGSVRGKLDKLSETLQRV
jgi:F-type H+-transporting ATPase subunit delta